MKKILALASAALLVAAILVGCSSKCDVCGKEGSTKKVTIAGESSNLCENCAALAELGAEMMGL